MHGGFTAARNDADRSKGNAMSALYLLIPLSIGLVGAAIWAFFWAVNHGQFEDLDSPATSVLDDDAPPHPVHKDPQP